MDLNFGAAGAAGTRAEKRRSTTHVASGESHPALGGDVHCAICGMQSDFPYYRRLHYVSSNRQVSPLHQEGRDGPWSRSFVASS